MNKLISDLLSFSLKNRPLILLISVGIVAAGVVAYLNTPIEAFPDVTNTRIQIITQWPGRSAEEVERFITIPIEVEMNSVPKKEHIRSVSLFGLSVINIIFDDEVEDFEARNYVSQRLSAVNLPDGVNYDLEPPYGPTGEIYRYTLTSTKRNVRELKTLQDWVIQRTLKQVPGIADVNSFGGEVKTFEVSVDPLELAKYDISALDVFQALQRSNVNVGGDVVVKSDQAYVVRGIGQLQNLDDIGNIIIQNIKDTPIRIKDIGQVRESNAPQLGYIGRDTSRNLVEAIVVLRRGENPGKVLVDLKAKIKDLNERILPADVKINTFYDRTELINFTVHTVTHNLLEGVILVTIVVFIFLFDWRATLIASIIIPFALLFAFICLRLRGMTANLLSMGAIDFGIIIDGTVVMVEGLFIVLDRKAHQIGMENYNKLSKIGLIRKEATALAKPIFFAKLIIILELFPIFTFQKVEGKMFSPLAWTLGFALLGAALATFTLVPVLISYLMNKNVKDKHTWVSTGLQKLVTRTLAWCFGHYRAVFVFAGGLLIFTGVIFTQLGSEFLPHLNEGAIYIRASLPYSASLQQSISFADHLRKDLKSFSEVRGILSQSGRPNDGTDATGFFNIELHVDLYPHEEWKENLTKDQLIEKMKAALAQYQGVNFNFSQPISDNVEEWVAGVKGALAVKIYGDDAYELERIGNKVKAQLKTVKGVEDLGVVGLVGQPELRIELDQSRMAAYGVTTADAQSVIEMAIGGKAATQLYDGERRFDIRVRYLPQYRQSDQALGDLLVPSVKGTKIPIKNIADIKSTTGLAFLYREDNKRFIAVKFSVEGRDLGSTITEAQAKVGKAIHLGRGQRAEWAGEFENQVRATGRLEQVVPVSLLLIFFLLYAAFGNVRDAGLIFLNVPFSLVGGILALYITGINFSISAGIGFIALMGVSTQSRVILVSIFKHNLEQKMPLKQAIYEGTLLRVRPVFMTALMAMLGLLPAALSSGIGSETQKPLAVVVIGGLLMDTILTLHIFPLIVERIYASSGKYTELGSGA